MATTGEVERHDLAEEVELLQAIYIHELQLQGPTERPAALTLFLHPSTGDDDVTVKYVCLSLCLVIPKEYPSIIPEISIQNPRGLSEAHINSIQENLVELAKDKTGTPMLYDLIEYAKECLTDNNIPSCPCVICLDHFYEEGTFIRTECYHYFHSHCLRKYIAHVFKKEEKLLCPMCRLEMGDVGVADDGTSDGRTGDESFVYKPDQQEQRAQRERQRILEYQKSKGGIIDIEEERNKYLIGIKNTKKESCREDNNVQLKSTGVEATTTAAGNIDKEVQQSEYVSDERLGAGTSGRVGIKHGDHRGKECRGGMSGVGGEVTRDNNSKESAVCVKQQVERVRNPRQNYRKQPRKQADSGNTRKSRNARQSWVDDGSGSTLRDGKECRGVEEITRTRGQEDVLKCPPSRGTTVEIRSRDTQRDRQDLGDKEGTITQGRQDTSKCPPLRRETKFERGRDDFAQNQEIRSSKGGERKRGTGGGSGGSSRDGKEWRDTEGITRIQGKEDALTCPQRARQGCMDSGGITRTQGQKGVLKYPPSREMKVEKPRWNNFAQNEEIRSGEGSDMRYTIEEDIRRGYLGLRDSPCSEKLPDSKPGRTFVVESKSGNENVVDQKTKNSSVQNLEATIPRPKTPRKRGVPKKIQKNTERNDLAGPAAGNDPPKSGDTRSARRIQRTGEDRKGKSESKSDKNTIPRKSSEKRRSENVHPLKPENLEMGGFTGAGDDAKRELCEQKSGRSWPGGSRKRCPPPPGFEGIFYPNTGESV